VLDLLDIRKNLVDGEFLGSLPDQLVLLAEVFRRKDLVGLPRFQQEAATGNTGLGNCRRCHRLIPQSRKPPGPDGRGGYTFSILMRRADEGKEASSEPMPALILCRTVIRYSGLIDSKWLQD